MGKVITCTLTLGRDKVYYHDTLSQADPRPEDIDQDILRRDTRNWLAGRIESNRRESTDENEAKLLGRHLYEAIFRGEIATRFHQRVDEAQGRLRLEIIFGEGAQELARLPWEFLYPNRGDRNDGFLAGEVERFTLTRFIGQPLGADKIPDPLERPVRLLLAVCAPGYSTEEFDGEEIRELKKLLDGSATAVDVRRLPNPTLKELQASVKDGSMGQDGPWLPDVVHIIGHGQKGAIMVHRNEQQIAADNANRLARRVREPAPEYEPVAAQTLKDMFTGRNSPKLVILQTCYGDAVDGGQLYSVAENIVGPACPRCSRCSTTSSTGRPTCSRASSTSTCSPAIRSTLPSVKGAAG